MNTREKEWKKKKLKKIILRRCTAVDDADGIRGYNDDGVDAAADAALTLILSTCLTALQIYYRKLIHSQVYYCIAVPTFFPIFI